MSKKQIFILQLAFTLLVCSFLIIPVFLSVLAGITQNFFVGIKSGFTIRWIYEVLDLYSETIYISLVSIRSRGLRKNRDIRLSRLS